VAVSVAGHCGALAEQCPAQVPVVSAVAGGGPASADVPGRAGWDLGQRATMGRGAAHGRGAREGGDASAQARSPARCEARRVFGDSAPAL